MGKERVGLADGCGRGKERVRSLYTFTPSRLPSGSLYWDWIIEDSKIRSISANIALYFHAFTYSKFPHPHVIQRIRACKNTFWQTNLSPAIPPTSPSPSSEPLPPWLLPIALLCPALPSPAPHCTAPRRDAPLCASPPCR